MKPAGRRRSRATGEHINIAAPPVVVLAEGMTGSLAKPPRWRTGGAAFKVERARGPRRSKAPHGFYTAEAKAERRIARAALAGLRAALASVDRNPV